MALHSTLQVMTFNLRKDSWLDRGNQWRYRKQSVTEFIQHSQMDLIGVQELMPAMKQDLERQLQGYTLFGNGRSSGMFNEHVDILVKDNTIKVCNTQTIWLSNQPDQPESRAFLAFFPRICTICEVVYKPTHQRLYVFNAHFDHISSYARKISIDIILNHIHQLSQFNSIPIILMGDFNMNPSNKLIQSLSLHQHPYDNIRLYNTLAQRHPNHARMITYHRFKGSKSSYAHFDYIFVSQHFHVSQAYVHDKTFQGRYLSDHYPVISILKFKQE